MERLKELDFWATFAIVLLTVYFSTLTVVNRSSFTFFIGPLTFTHWLSLTGGLWIAFVTPAYYILKHHITAKIKALMRIHILGNLVAFMLISVHFTYWITSVGFMGTGLALFVAVFTLVLTGLLQRFTLIKSSRRQIRFLHVSMTTAFYLILTIHILSHLVRL